MSCNSGMPCFPSMEEYGLMQAQYFAARDMSRKKEREEIEAATRRVYVYMITGQYWTFSVKYLPRLKNIRFGGNRWLDAIPDINGNMVHICAPHVIAVVYDQEE